MACPVDFDRLWRDVPTTGEERKGGVGFSVGKAPPSPTTASSPPRSAQRNRRGGEAGFRRDMFTTQPIHEAAAGGQLAHVQGMLEKDPKLLHARDTEYGWTPLIYAASEGQLGMVKLLLQSGADIDDSDDDGDTALQIACVHGHCAAVTLLTEQGANVRHTWTHAADARGEGGHVAAVELLVAHTDTDVDTADGRQQTALWIAASVGCEEVVKVLLCAGADPFIADEQGRTPREVAAQMGKYVCARLLEEWETTYTFSRARRLRDATADVHHLRPLPSTPHTPFFQHLPDHHPTIDTPTGEEDAILPLYLCTRVAHNTMALPWVGRAVDAERGDGHRTGVRHDDGGALSGGGCGCGGGGGGGCSAVVVGRGRKRSFEELSDGSRGRSNGEKRCRHTCGSRQRSDGGDDVVVSTRMGPDADVDVGCDGDRGGGGSVGYEGLCACGEGWKTMSGMVAGYLLGDLKSELFVEMLESVI